MKKFLVMALFGLVGFAAFAGTCVVTHISLVSTDGSHKTFAGQLDNTSGVNILQHNFVVAFIDSGNNLIGTTTVPGCLRSVQNGSTDYFSAVSAASASNVSVGLARIAFDGTFKVGTTSAQDVTISGVGASRSTTTLTVAGKVTNNASSTLGSPNVCIVVRTSAGNVLITGTVSLSDITSAANRTFSDTITVPDDSSAVSSVDIWVDGLDSSGNPTTPESNLGTSVGTGTPTPTATATTTANKLAFSTQPVGGVGINTNFGVMPVVQVQTSGGTLVTTGSGSTASVTLAVKPGTAPAGTVLSCTANTVTAVGGVATFAGCKLNHAASGIVLTATAASLTSADSTGIAILPGTATTLAFQTNPAGAFGGSAFLTQPVVVVQDANGDTVWTGTNSTASITLTLAGGSGVLSGASCTPPMAAVAGVAAFTTCSIDLTGLKALGAAAAGLTSATSATFTVTVGAPAKLAINQPNNTTSGTAFTTQPLVTVLDAGGNLTASTASITLTSSGGVLACTANPLAAVAGTATFAGCKITGAGSWTITAASAGLTSAVTTAITIT